MGGGFAGQIIAQCARRKGAYRVIVVDVLEGKLALARRLGADITLNPGQDDVIEAVKDLTNGLGADVVDQYYDSLSVDKVNARFLSWLADNCADYGFVIRYPSDKVSITGRNEPWHVRYVGETAAKFMTEHNLCLEEFVALYQ